LPNAAGTAEASAVAAVDSTAQDFRGRHSFARPSMGRIHGRPGGFGSFRFNTSRLIGSRFSSDFGRSRFGVRNSIISQPRFGFGDGDFDFDDGFGFRRFGFGCFGCGFGWGWGFGSWSWWSPWGLIERIRQSKATLSAAA
jgi:hypothetical protein